MLGVREDQYRDMASSYKGHVYKRFLPKGGVVYDIGAYRGVLSCLFAEDGYKVYAIEGSPRNIGYLRENCSKYSNIEVHHISLSDRVLDVNTRFNDCIDGTNPMQSISYRILDSYISENNLLKPSLVKMDIEGMESLVLKGASDLLENVRPIWQLSLHEHHSWKYDNYPAWVSVDEGGFDFSIFKKLYYKIMSIDMVLCDRLAGHKEYFIIPMERISYAN